MPQSNRAPVPPPLEAAIANPCAPLPLLVTDTVGELIQWAKDAALDYATCQARHRGAVGAYSDARDAAIEANGSKPE